MPKPSKRPAPPQFLGFINVDLTAEQKRQLKLQDFRLEDVENVLVSLTEQNYKITLSYDDSHSVYSAFLAQKDPTHDNAGWILAGKGSTPIKALKQLVFIHYQICRELWRDWSFKGANAELDD